MITNEFLRYNMNVISFYHMKMRLSIAPRYFTIEYVNIHITDYFINCTVHFTKKNNIKDDFYVFYIFLILYVLILSSNI
jgi:hypothetical protein